MRLNTNISLENIITIVALICSVTLAFGFMQYDIDLIEEKLDLKADRELIDYKLDIIIQDIAEIKETLKEKK
ncbi:hypothetical protein [uncultured Mediterranean phage uvMED]|jgi:hypothetical protein|nr:hypothetical protein [uncultured Mediterranean phage uvMED]